MQARYRNADGDIQLVHTLNGSGLGRWQNLAAVVENNQLGDGTIAVPEVLRGYLGGADRWQLNP